MLKLQRKTSNSIAKTYRIIEQHRLQRLLIFRELYDFFSSSSLNYFQGQGSQSCDRVLAEKRFYGSLYQIIKTKCKPIEKIKLKDILLIIKKII